MKLSKVSPVVLASVLGVVLGRDAMPQVPAGVVDRPINRGAAAAVAQPAGPANGRLTALSTVQLPANAIDRARLAEAANDVPCVEVATMMSISRTIDSTPLERPRALTVVQGDRTAVLGRVSTVLRSNGFTETSRDIDSGELRATRPDTNAENARDELLIWIDGQAGDAGRVRVYMQYGRFEQFFMQGGQRVHVTPEEAVERIGAVRDAVVNLETL
jgi:hypothetical protein